MRPELAVGAVVIVAGRLLLVERGRGAGKGSWSIPGGHVEPGETMATAVVRELREETGLSGRVVRHLGFVERIGESWHYVIHDYLVDVSSATDALDVPAAVAGDDAAATAWWPISELEQHPALTPGLVEFLTDCGLAAPGRTEQSV